MKIRIPASNRDKVYELFYHADMSRIRGVGEFGLARAVIEGHGSSLGLAHAQNETAALSAGQSYRNSRQAGGI